MKDMPEIIAEIGVNYYDIALQRSLSPLEAAKLMVLEAKEAGIRVVKFQTYKAEKLASEDSPAYWDTKEEPTRSQRELFSKFDKLTLADYRSLADYCNAVDVEFMTTFFDTESARALDPVVKRHKIASADLTNEELLSLIGSFRKPVLLSTGASAKVEIKRAVAILQKAGATRITLLHCVLLYPTPVERANLWKIVSLKKEFPEFPVGYSDHVKVNLDVLLTAWLLGAEVIEKHFTLDKNLRGNDHYHAAAPEDMRLLVGCFSAVRKMIGTEVESWYDEYEEKARKFARRGVYLARDVYKNEPLNENDVEFLRPQADGISPSEWIERLSKGENHPADMKKGQLIR